MEGVDYAFSNPSPTGLYAAGKRFAMRYVGPGTAPKHLTPAERDALWAGGLSVVLLAEGAEGDIFAGAAMGAAHARLAVSDRAALGFPEHRPVYFAADKDVTPANIGAAVDYFHGVATVMPAVQVGVYGDVDIMARLRELGLATWFFQSAAMFWSHGIVFPHNTVRQYHNGVPLAGGIVDLCNTEATDYGQWLPAVPEQQEEQIMRFTFTGFANTPPGAEGRVHITDGLRFRVLESASKRDALHDSAGAGPITAVTPGVLYGWDYPHAVTQLCGSPDPGEQSGEASELANYVITLPGPITGIAKPATE